MTQSKRPRKTFTPGFKHQLVQLYKNSKRKYDITKEFDVGYSTLDKWIKQEENSGSFKVISSKVYYVNRCNADIFRLLLILGQK